jgi:hypothetical protein
VKCVNDINLYTLKLLLKHLRHKHFGYPSEYTHEEVRVQHPPIFFLQPGQMIAEAKMFLLQQEQSTSTHLCIPTVSASRGQMVHTVMLSWIS